MNKKVRVTRETTSGLNTHFSVPGKPEITRGQFAREIEAGLHPGYHVMRDVEGRKIPRSNPDKKPGNNLG